ncbi:hypothetical protein BCB68_01705 [Leptotrichia sp. oral taxon 498]|nr:hypothetical protein BCB68_01705 [Leptotrichia sp. oral taxon 498]
MKKNKINLKVIISFVTYFFLNILAYILFFNLIFKKNFFIFIKFCLKKRISNFSELLHLLEKK